MLAIALPGLALVAPAARAQFRLGFQEPGFGPGSTPAQANAANRALHAVDASVDRIAVGWATVAPDGTKAPDNFHPANPADPHYRWAQLDAAVRGGAQHGLQPILTFVDAPPWAQGPGPVKPYVSPGGWDPNPAKFAAFLRAAAVRYSGGFPDPQRPGAQLPRVMYWEPWNEPNIPGYFSAPDPIHAYRTLLNYAYDTLKAVRHDNVVIFGALAPVSPVPGSIPPLDFGAQLLCLHRVGPGFARNRSCRRRVKFDVFGMHPYALAATPTKHAYKRGDVLVGDMGEVKALVSATNRFHTAVPITHHAIWVTEFAWYTNPPNPVIGDSQPTAARYVAYSMYEMWRSGVSLVTWLDILDGPGHDAASGPGLYSSSGRPKLTLRALAFPVVASVSHGRAFVWGRAPVSTPAHVKVERAFGRAWRAVATVRTGADGVFQVRFGAHGAGLYRAQVAGGPTSLAYDSRPIPPRRTHVFKIF